MIDLRSDTVTRPTPEMRQAMHSAELGDDVYGDDPSINQFEEIAAEQLGTEAALFLPSGTQSNLVALLTHCQRGDEYIVGHDAHTYKYEGGGAAALGGIQPQTVPFGKNGVLDLEEVDRVIKDDDFHFARTRLLALENTQHGRIVPLEYFPKARELATANALALHLDGARVFNAAVKLEIPPAQITGYFDSVSVCLSKGLGAPIGSVLCSNQPFIDEARRWRKVVGGGMRQAGMLAAGGMIALTKSNDYLALDHENATMLDNKLGEIEEVEVNHAWTQTNMVWARFAPSLAPGLKDFLLKQGILLSLDDQGQCRFVTHRDVSSADILKVVGAIKDFFSKEQAGNSIG